MVGYQLLLGHHPFSHRIQSISSPLWTVSFKVLCFVLGVTSGGGGGGSPAFLSGSGSISGGAVPTAASYSNDPMTSSGRALTKTTATLRRLDNRDLLSGVPVQV